MKTFGITLFLVGLIVSIFVVVSIQADNLSSPYAPYSAPDSVHTCLHPLANGGVQLVQCVPAP